MQVAETVPTGERRAGLGTKSAALGFLICCMVLNTSFGGGVYLGQLALAAAILWAGISGLVTGRSVAWAVIGMVVVMGLSFVSAGATDTPNPAYVGESLKILLIALGAWCLTRFPLLVFALRQQLPFVCLVTVTWTFFLGDWNYYDPVLPRFGVPQWGSPNSTAIVIGSALLVLLGRERATGHWQRRTAAAGVAALVGVGLGTALVATMSRGGIIAFVLALLIRARRRLRILVPLLSLLAIAYVGLVRSGVPRADVLLELTETGGSGRVAMWRELMADIASSPAAVALGRGPGSVDLNRRSGPVVSAHSTFVTVIYFFGLAGSVLMALALIGIARRVLSASADFRDRLGWPLLGFLILGGLFDYYAGAAQLGWLFAFLLAILWLTNRAERASALDASVPPAANAPVGQLA